MQNVLLTESQVDEKPTDFFSFNQIFVKILTKLKIGIDSAFETFLQPFDPEVFELKFGSW